MARALWPHEVSRNKRAVRRAKAILRPGDRIAISTCGGRLSTVTMVGWSDSFPDFIASKTLVDDELHPINVRKVNGVSVSFDDPKAIAKENEGG